jgi:cysteine desulfurase
MRRVYLDHSATTPVRPEVVEAMLPYFTEEYGNASSVHSFGQRAHAAMEDARASIASLIGASPDEIVFTGGGTESNNLAIKGVAAVRLQRRHVITSAIEHHAVLNPCGALEKSGYRATYLPVDRSGLVDPEELRRVLAGSAQDTAIVSIMLANNEVGTMEPVRELAAVATEFDVPFHTDAVQAVGKVPVSVEELGVDLMSFSAHKFYGPKGVGALYVRGGTRIAAVQHGGHHEGNRRAGTENVPGIVGMACALELACGEMDSEVERLHELRDRLQAGLMERVPDHLVNGHASLRLPHLLNMSFENVEGEAVLLSLDAVGIAASTGSACTSGTLEPSHVLMAMGIPPEIAHSSLRFSLGRTNTEEDIEYVLEKLPPIIQRLRQMSPFSSPHHAP